MKKVNYKITRRIGDELNSRYINNHITGRQLIDIMSGKEIKFKSYIYVRLYKSSLKKGKRFVDHWNETGKIG